LVFLFLLGFSSSDVGPASAPQSIVSSFGWSSSVSGEIEGSRDGSGAEARTRVWAFRVIRRTSGWLTVTKSDEFEFDEMEL
jgi:hypothetical protein